MTGLVILAVLGTAVPILTVVALVAAVATPLVTFLVAARRFSGKIGTSDAKELWAESRSIRDWSQTRIHDLEKRVDVLEAANNALTIQARELTATIVDLKDEIHTLTEELKFSRARVIELEGGRR